jgi:hypothetical protein
MKEHRMKRRRGIPTWLCLFLLSSAAGSAT